VQESFVTYKESGRRSWFTFSAYGRKNAADHNYAYADSESDKAKYTAVCSIEQS